MSQQAATAEKPKPETGAATPVSDSPVDPSAPPSGAEPSVLDSITESQVGKAPNVSPQADRISESLQSDKGLSESAQVGTKVGRPPKYANDEERRAAARERARERRARERGQSTIGGRKTDQEQQAEAEQERKQAAYREVGVFFAESLFGFTSTIDETEWKPTEQQRQSITANATRVAEKYDIDDMPPLLALVVSIIAYAAPNLQKPKSSKKAAGFFAKMRNWIAARKGK